MKTLPAPQQGRKGNNDWPSGGETTGKYPLRLRKDLGNDKERRQAANRSDSRRR